MNSNGVIKLANRNTAKTLTQTESNTASIDSNQHCRLTDLSKSGGCGCKVDPSALSEFLSKTKGFEKEDKTYNGEHPIQEVRMREINKTLEVNGLQDVKKAKVRERFHETITS